MWCLTVIEPYHPLWYAAHCSGNSSSLYGVGGLRGLPGQQLKGRYSPPQHWGFHLTTLLVLEALFFTHTGGLYLYSLAAVLSMCATSVANFFYSGCDFFLYPLGSLHHLVLTTLHGTGSFVGSHLLSHCVFLYYSHTHAEF